VHSDPYVVLARKWRPAQFKDMIGQAHIVRTLNNAIQSNRLHHAYLFTGSRGIGKTSIARIFAKVIRCESLSDPTNQHHLDEFLQSCDRCSSCKEISASSSVDVIEIDGASNNGVEAVREIRDHVRYMPSQGSKKIYIIDEVHMLTTAAFNALLKTLEEPPAHVIFIFATTEPHKIPATVLSRCQRFDYRRVTVSQIQTRLIEIAQAEGIEIESSALTLIGRAAEGSMRDALSLFDQVIAFSSGTISLQSVRESIGLIEGQTLIQILSGIFNKRPANALAFVEKAHNQGHDLRLLTRGLIEFLYYTLLIQVDALDRNSMEVSNEELEELKTLAALRTPEEIELFFQVFHQGLETLARSPQPKIVLNVLIIKCATAEALFSVDQKANHTPNSETEKDRTIQSEATIPRIQEQKSTSVTHLHPLSPRTQVSIPSNQDQSPSPSHVPQPPQQACPKQETKKTWEGLIDYIRKFRPLLASILEHSSGTVFPQDQNTTTLSSLTVYFSPEEIYFKEQLQSRIYQQQLGALSKEYLGFSVQLQIEFRNSGESLVTRREREDHERREKIRNQATHHPIIAEAKSLFGGDLSPIHLVEDIHAELST